jgi:hypothetical protein
MRAERTSMASSWQQTARDEFEDLAQVHNHTSVLILDISPDVVLAQYLEGSNGLRE